MGGADAVVEPSARCLPGGSNLPYDDARDDDAEGRRQELTDGSAAAAAAVDSCACAPSLGDAVVLLDLNGFGKRELLKDALV